MDLILHHYDSSPFSEKARLALGRAGLPWASVIEPVIMPKPDLVALTGGYRRIPVMQSGADIWCDSQAILAEIARRAPSPALAATNGAWAVNLWADRLWFQASVAVIFAEIGDKVPAAFIADREKLSGRPFDVAAMKAAAAPMREQWRAQAAWIEEGLQEPFLAGDAASLTDIAAYMNPWFVKSAAPQMLSGLLAGLPRVQAWMERMADLGHGRRREMTTADALAVARAAQPKLAGEHDPGGPLAPGCAVNVAADDYGRDPIQGVLVFANARGMAIDRDAGDLGRIRVHFPRVGYQVWAT